MNCDKCGKSNSAQAKFCGKCGFTLKSLVAEEPLATQQESAAMSVEPTPAAVQEKHLNPAPARQEETVGAAMVDKAYAHNSDSSTIAGSKIVARSPSAFSGDGDDSDTGVASTVGGTPNRPLPPEVPTAPTNLVPVTSREEQSALIVGPSVPADELKSLINTQFNNNYSNQAAIKKYLDAHTEQLKSITFQLESIKNFQATINYELIINEINDKYNAITQSINEKFFAPNFRGDGFFVE